MTYILTAEQAAKQTWLTSAEQTQRTLPATEKQVAYIADLLMEGRTASQHRLPAKGSAPTRDELRAYNRAMASAAIKELESSSISLYGLGSIRRILAA